MLFLYKICINFPNYILGITLRGRNFTCQFLCQWILCKWWTCKRKYRQIWRCSGKWCSCTWRGKSFFFVLSCFFPSFRIINHNYLCLITKLVNLQWLQRKYHWTTSSDVCPGIAWHGPSNSIQLVLDSQQTASIVLYYKILYNYLLWTIKHTKPFQVT